MAFWNRNKKKAPHPPESDELERVLSGSWEELEVWIREMIGGGFDWKVRPRDTRANREMLVESISGAIGQNDGSFPERNAFLERAN
jgi:hypothetical protein